MKPNLIALVLAAATSLSAAAQTKGKDLDASPQSTSTAVGLFFDESVRVDVKELANGATVAWTSKDPATIKKIQEMARGLASKTVGLQDFSAAVKEGKWKEVNKMLESGVRHGLFGNMNLSFKIPTPDSIAKGKGLFEAHCGICHGIDAKGTGIAAKQLEVPPANLIDVAKHLPNRRFVMQMRFGGGDMPAWQDILDEDEMLNITHYLKTLTIQ